MTGPPYHRSVWRLTLERALRPLRTAIAGSDIVRWRRVEAETPLWDGRNALIAALVPDGSRVLDLGSGAGTLGRRLEGRCVYQACDLLPRGPGSLLFDFNRGIWPAVGSDWDWAVLSGVLEYARDPRSLLAFASRTAAQVIVSYSPYRAGTRILRGLNGWVNTFTEPELLGLFSELGLDARCASKWQDQPIFVLGRRQDSELQPRAAAR